MNIPFIGHPEVRIHSLIEQRLNSKPKHHPKMRIIFHLKLGHWLKPKFFKVDHKLSMYLCRCYPLLQQMLLGLKCNLTNFIQTKHEVSTLNWLYFGLWHSSHTLVAKLIILLTLFVF